MSYINPENALKHAQEFKAEGNIDAALEELHQALHSKKFKGNNIILEKIMLEMIDICSENLTTQYLKEDIGHFRNVCQHTNMSMLENVLKNLKAKTDEILKKVEEKEGEEKVRQILSEDSAQNLAFLSGDGDLNPDDLLYMANCQFDQVLEKSKIMPSINFYIEVCKIILDTLRQNSKLLDFYNTTAMKCFDFCAKYNYKSEYQKISETIHSHFNQIIKLQKHPEALQQSKIPFPVKLDEEDALQKVLELRYQQLKIALRMRVWSDAFRTSENIYQLINRQKHHASRMKQILADFFENLSLIFWESEFYLFHAYSLMNLQSIIKFNKAMTDQQKSQMNTMFVLAALSIPLDNRISNFEKLNVQYIPQGMNEFYDESSFAKNELLGIANMLQVKGIPSRSSLINYLKVKNLHLSQEFPQIQELFRLIEEEESPFTISQKGKKLLDEIVAVPNTNWGKYKVFIVKNLSVRILQKCKNYFRNMKMSALQKLLGFYESFQDIEKLLYECNNQNLIQTVIDHKTQSITFNQEVEVASNLMKFGLKLKEAFQKVQSVVSEGKERERIFMKVKEKMEQEMNEVLKRKEDMVKMKEDIERNKAEESKTLQDILLQQQQEREKQFAKQQVKEEKERQKNKLLEELELMRKIRAQEVLQDLIRRGVKKVNGVKITDLDKKGDAALETLDYDTIMNFYQNLLKKEKEAFEAEKKKKMKDVEYWVRAVREEEKVAIEKYCQEHGEEEMKQIQKAIQDRHEKELRMKQSLEKAFPVYQVFREGIMRERKVEHEKKMEVFITKKGEELKKKILDEARAELKKIENLRKVQEAEKARKERDARIAQERKEKGIVDDVENDDATGWKAGTARQPEPRDDGLRRGPANEGPRDGFLSRQGFGKAEVAQRPPEEEKKEEFKGRPTFTRQRKDDNADSGFGLNRSGMGTQKAQEQPPKKEETKQSWGGPSRFTNTAKQGDSGSGFQRGGGAATQSNTQANAQTGFQRQQPAAAPKKNDDAGDWNFASGGRKGAGAKK